MRTSVIVSGLGLTLSGLLTACAHEPATGESVTEVCGASNDQKLVSVSGYFAAPSFMLCSKTCQLRITAERDAEEPYITVNVPVGEGPGHVEKLPEKFTAADVKVQTHSGDDVKIGSVVRITGKALVSEGSCQISSLDKIEKL